MKLLIEEYKYPIDVIKDFFPHIDELDPVDGEARVNYVGYYYNAEKGESVFILPKVVLKKEEDEKNEKVFGEHHPCSIIDLGSPNNPLSKKEREFIYGLSVWIYRAIAVYRADAIKGKRDHTIIRHQNIVRQGKGHKRTANTYLDILLSLIDFAKQNRDWFTFIIRNLHLGYNKIHWGKTIAKSQVVVQDDEPVYLDPVTKNRRINFDEELLVIFYSILAYIHEEYGFPVEINVNYELITGKRFKRYLDGYGLKRLRQIRYKYFSDKALQLWDLCFAFFEQSTQIRIAAQMNEYLLAKNFNIVFEAMIDELIGETTFPDGLNKKQEDGKEVDHMFLWDSLTKAHRPDEDKEKVYYLGDSKYYKQKNKLGPESVAKQFTYARNVIQWNLNLFVGKDADEEKDICLRDDVTEGYNVIPNFFISGTIPSDLSYNDNISQTKNRATTHLSRQFVNRLFDRDTLLVTHYDVNFLFVLSLYARNNAARKAEWQHKVRNIFRDEIRKELDSRYQFHALRAKPGIDTKKWLKENFADILGKVFAPYPEDKGIIALALSNPDIKENEHVRNDIIDENARVLALVDTAFTRKQLDNLSTDPRPLLPPPAVAPVLSKMQKRGVILLTQLHDTNVAKIATDRRVAIGIKQTDGSTSILEHLNEIGTLIVHKRNREQQWIFPVTSIKVETPDKLDNPIHRYPAESFLFIVLELGDLDGDLYNHLDCTLAKPKYDAIYSTLDELQTSQII